MSLIKSVAVPFVTVGAICTALAVTATKADASSFCMPLMGGEVCTEVGSTEDVVIADLPAFGAEIMTIKCRDGGFHVSSQGQWSRQEVREFVRGYCSTRGWYAHG